VFFATRFAQRWTFASKAGRRTYESAQGSPLLPAALASKLDLTQNSYLFNLG